VLDFINFLLAISFYILAKSEFELVIFREALGVALRNGRNHPSSISRWSELWVDFLKNPLASEPEFGGF
jgi:hypothetical protein